MGRVDSSKLNPHFRGCGTGYVTDTGERVSMPTPLAPAIGFSRRATGVCPSCGNLWEECNPNTVDSDCK
eukprot:916652-Amphidinium_carterae.1